MPENNTHQNLTLHRFLDTDGDGTGTKNAIGNYSGGEEIFYIQPPAGVVYRISRLLFSMEDGVIQNWPDYGGITGGVATGLELATRNDAEVLVDLTDGVLITSNGDFRSHCEESSMNNGSGNDWFNAVWNFQGAGQVLRLDGDQNERLEVILNDDFSGLAQHYFKVDGEIENTRT